jgi:hypothetical protein
MQTNADERDLTTETEDLVANDTADETGNEAEASFEASDDADTGATDEETVSVSRAEYAKLQREAAAAKRLRERREKGDQESREEGSANLDKAFIEQVERLTLSQAGITDPDVQDEALRLAKKLGMNAVQVSRDNDIKSILAAKQKAKVAQKSVASSQAAAASQNKGVDYWVAKYQRDGSLPEDRKILAQLMDKLAG